MIRGSRAIRAVPGGGWGLANGLWLSTYFERTEQARIDDAQGEVWIWVATLVLAVAALIAHATG